MKWLPKPIIFALLLPAFASADAPRWYAALPEDYVNTHCKVATPALDEKGTTDFLAARNVTIENPSDFTSEEKDDIREAFLLYPDYFLPFWIPIRIASDPSVCSEDPRTGFKTQILLEDDLHHARLRICPDRWHGTSHFERIQAIVHEFAHLLGNAARHAEGSDEWISLTQSSDPKVSEYARRAGASEDFAETLVAYRLTPDRLYGLSPRKYEFIRHAIFGGTEFRTEGDCSRVPATDLSTDQAELVQKMFRKSKNVQDFADLYDRPQIRKTLGDSRFFVLLSARLGRLPYPFGNASH